MRLVLLHFRNSNYIFVWKNGSFLPLLTLHKTWRLIWLRNSCSFWFSIMYIVVLQGYCLALSCPTMWSVACAVACVHNINCCRMSREFLRYLKKSCMVKGSFILPLKQLNKCGFETWKMLGPSHALSSFWKLFQFMNGLLDFFVYYASFN